MLVGDLSHEPDVQNIIANSRSLVGCEACLNSHIEFSTIQYRFNKFTNIHRVSDGALVWSVGLTENKVVS